jgi:hypothetical protein
MYSTIACWACCTVGLNFSVERELSFKAMSISQAPSSEFACHEYGIYSSVRNVAINDSSMLANLCFFVFLGKLTEKPLSSLEDLDL